jgi:hypothetical protein
MTKDIYQKQSMVKYFFSAEASEEKRKLLLQNFGIDYVFVGEEEALGDYDPGTAPYLRACFSAPKATVYCVNEDQLAQTDSNNKQD